MSQLHFIGIVVILIIFQVVTGYHFIMVTEELNTIRSDIRELHNDVRDILQELNLAQDYEGDLDLSVDPMQEYEQKYESSGHEIIQYHETIEWKPQNSTEFEQWCIRNNGIVLENTCKWDSSINPRPEILWEGKNETN